MSLHDDLAKKHSAYARLDLDVSSPARLVAHWRGYSGAAGSLRSWLDAADRLPH